MMSAGRDEDRLFLLGIEEPTVLPWSGEGWWWWQLWGAPVASLELLLPENSFLSDLSSLSVELGSFQGVADSLKYK